MSSLLRRVLKRRTVRGKWILSKSRRRRQRLRPRSRGGIREEEKINRFEQWCKEMSIELHPQLSIGYDGSCADVGVVALADIPRGARLAVIPRHALLNATNSRVGVALRRDRKFRKQLKDMNSWVPLLLALLAEYGDKTTSAWEPYLSLVPSRRAPGPPLMWSEEERRRLLLGTGVRERVERDRVSIARDYEEIVLPFMRRHPQMFRKTYHSLQLYEHLVCFVMAYSFTDGDVGDQCQQTMMVPFVDLLNHHSEHHVELRFQQDHLELVAVRRIRKGEEVMNTYGPLSNASLLHTYGFTEHLNPHDVALIPSSVVRGVYKREVGGASHSQRWEQVMEEDVMMDEYEVDSSGRPEQSLLALVKLLLVDEEQYASLRNHLMDVEEGEEEEEEEGLCVKEMSPTEQRFLCKLCASCLAQFPEQYDELLSTVHQLHLMTKRERHALQLTIGQQQCLRKFRDRLQGGTSVVTES